MEPEEIWVIQREDDRLVTSSTHDGIITTM